MFDDVGGCRESSKGEHRRPGRATATASSSSFGRQTAACQKLRVEDHSVAGREGAGEIALISLPSHLLVLHESLPLAEHTEVH